MSSKMHLPLSCSMGHLWKVHACIGIEGGRYRVAMMELMSMSLAEAAREIKARKISPVELVRASLSRIDQLNNKVNAFITVCHDQALAVARQAENEIASGNYRGPMHGIPYSVKDVFATKGIRTTRGSKVFADYVPDHNSTAVKHLNRAGGVLVGKNHCLEFACGNHHKIFGEVRNPWSLEHSPGGSSSGSGAAVAAGMVFGSMGSCTTGSIRGPASWCSVVGLKPTSGLISRFGVFPLSWSLDHVGPMTRTVEDCAIMLHAVAGFDWKDPSSASVNIPEYAGTLDRNIRGLRVGVPTELSEGNSPEVSNLVNTAIRTLERLGADVRPVSVPLTGQYASIAATVIYLSEAAQIHSPWLSRLREYTVRTQQKVLVGLTIPSIWYHKAQELRRLISHELSSVMQEVDLLISSAVLNTPSRVAASPASDWDAEAAKAAISGSLYSPMEPYNLTGMPAISVPCGFTEAGMPVGLQIAGRLFEDLTVLKVAFAYEQAAGVYQKHPRI